MKQIDAISGYRYHNAARSHAHAYLLPTVDKLLTSHLPSLAGTRLFDLGCGNGSVAAHFASQGCEVAGVDPSTEGIKQANQEYPDLQLRVGSGYDNLSATFGTFPAVISLEVIEHVYSPRDFAATLINLLEPGGVAVISTPYHGYIKNLALAVTGKMDSHFTALWDHGHIKFWSFKTLGQLLREAGFHQIEFHRVGRFPALAKSMIAVARKPSK